MIPQEHRVIAALGHLGPLVVPGIWAPRWWQWRAKRRERAIRHALSAAGLPSPDYMGRVRLWSQFGEVAGRSEVSVVEWARAWCRVLDLPFMVGDTGFVFDTRSRRFSPMTAHERIQLLREEQALAAGRGGAKPDPVEIRATPSNKFTNSLVWVLLGTISLVPRRATPGTASTPAPSQSSKNLSRPRHLDPRGTDIPIERQD